MVHLARTSEALQHDQGCRALRRAAPPDQTRRLAPAGAGADAHGLRLAAPDRLHAPGAPPAGDHDRQDRKSTRLNSSHGYISYAVFCLKKKSSHVLSRMSKTKLDIEHDIYA